MLEQNDHAENQSIVKIKEELICDIKSEIIEVEVKKEYDCYVKSETDLYENHVIKEEMVIGPVVFQKYFGSKDAAQPTDPILETQIKKTDESNPPEDTVQENDTIERIAIKIEYENDMTTNEIVQNQNTEISSEKFEEDKNNMKQLKSIEIYFCKSCEKQFEKQCMFAQHICNERKQNIYLNCNECPYQADTQDSLERHKKFLHDKDRRFICNECGYRFKEKHRLNAHLNTVHADNKKYQCKVCEYKTNDRSTMERHERIHSKKKLYSCKECEYKSRFKHNVTSHNMTKHTGEKQFTCSICDYKCIQKGHLKRHVQTHTGKKMFSCSVCGHKCIQKCNLNRHMKIHHKD